MPKQSRLDAPGTLHHVMERGIEGTKAVHPETTSPFSLFATDEGIGRYRATWPCFWGEGGEGRTRPQIVIERAGSVSYGAL